MHTAVPVCVVFGLGVCFGTHVNKREGVLCIVCFCAWEKVRETEMASENFKALTEILTMGNAEPFNSLIRSIFTIPLFHAKQRSLY